MINILIVEFEAILENRIFECLSISILRCLIARRNAYFLSNKEILSVTVLVQFCSSF